MIPLTGVVKQTVCSKKYQGYQLMIRDPISQVDQRRPREGPVNSEPRPPQGDRGRLEQGLGAAAPGQRTHPREVVR